MADELIPPVTLVSCSATFVLYGQGKEKKEANVLHQPSRLGYFRMYVFTAASSKEMGQFYG